MKKIVAIGEILVEIMATERGNGFREPLSLIGPYPSGAPAIFIDQAARFGQPCALLSCVGEDDFGKVNLDRLERDGVDISGIRIDPELPTGSAFVRYRPDGARDFVFNIKHSASSRTELNEAARRVVQGCDHLHVMGTSLFSQSIVETILEAIDIVKGRGGTVSFDPNARPELLSLPGIRSAFDAIFARCDLIMPSGSELFLFTKSKDEAGAVAEILAGTVRAVVVKRGSDGATYFDRSGKIHQPAFSATEIDPTGAGDCFGAIFVSCWLRGMRPGDALRYAAAGGAHAVEKQGPMEGAATLDEIESFIQRRGRP